MPLLCAGAAVIGLLAAPAAASAAAYPAHTRPGGPAARFASAATAHQNKVIEGVLARDPGGIRVSGSEVKWPDGTVLGVPASAAQDELLACLDAIPQLAFCSFTAPNYEGTWLSSPQAVAGGAYWTAWGNLFPGQGMYSWFNSTETRVWREQFQNHGDELCISPWPKGNYTNSNYDGPNLFDYWILFSINQTQC